MVGLFYMLMATAGLLTEGIVSLFHAVPTTRTIQVTSAHFEWNYTTYLNIVFIGVAASVWWLARNKASFGGGHGYAIDPVCGMQIRIDDAPAHASFAGKRYPFCSDRCRERFDANPEHFTTDGARPAGMPVDQSVAVIPSSTPSTHEGSTVIDPVCGMTVDPATAAAHRRYKDADYWFCNPGCAEAFDADPEHYLTATPRARTH